MHLNYALYHKNWECSEEMVSEMLDNEVIEQRR